jgi:hypothetical protein
MVRCRSSSRIVALALAVTAVGCASFRGRSQRETSCYPQQCFLDVQNDNGQSIAVRYFDSTGSGDLLGLVIPGGVRRFVLPRRTSRAVVVEVKREHQVYRSQTTVLLPQYENLIHFPADFELASGPLAEIKK